MSWRARLDSIFSVQVWDDESVVYNSLSGDTHQLGVLATRILLSLQTAPASTEAIVAAMASAFMVDPTDAFVSQIDDVLAGLRSLALIEAA